jgi:hypothetical protein
MRRLSLTLLGAASLVHLATSAAPSVYPTGTTLYDPTRAWNGYTVLTPLGPHGAIVIDMNGNTVKQWPELVGSSGGPARILPGGFVVGAADARAGFQEAHALVQQDFAGNVVWRFDRSEEIESRDGTTPWSARQHHDWQRSDFPAGYYSPGAPPPATSGVKTLILTHTNVAQPNVADVLLQDDRIIELSWDGEVLWEWIASDHIDELGFAEDARDAIRNAPGPFAARNGFDWLHLNSATYVGANRWHDDGDARFAPENVIISSRSANIVAIVSREDGSILWRLGPDFRETEATRAIRQIIGQHHAHLIPPGLPGAGNMLIFDNGGSGGYGFATPAAPNGTNSLTRASSRVLEIDPVTLEVVWSYSAGARFYSSNIAGMQRLPNGNTLITEGAGGRMFEVTVDGEIVWEYMSPYFSAQGPTQNNAVYRAYRLPYGWIPQLERPQETAVTPPPLSEFRVD